MKRNRIPFHRILSQFHRILHPFHRILNPFHRILHPFHRILHLLLGNLCTLKYCSNCGIFVPPRAYHCRFCGVCIRNFDHHCPWVSNCVGIRNHKFFLWFLVAIFDRIHRSFSANWHVSSVWSLCSWCSGKRPMNTFRTVEPEKPADRTRCSSLLITFPSSGLR
ncbi:uncharacterized protein [Blastocystis hominis]|uniref:Palmitoyltransferase n=1 Tax=Blastocystis hominis TaxID=12968 RepID=D8LVX0_BLAHO|nr:uncharacterized protein [Blastocystis hominis]CBK19959.2 unnamed protein product [Blastocystis hominis]|eukprot:XP_012894007.1 uncharacterized protein [Blastocystis hominis]